MAASERGFSLLEQGETSLLDIERLFVLGNAPVQFVDRDF
jgi:hypothetical protein